MFGYRKARRIVLNATQVFTEAFPQLPPCLANVQVAAATTYDGVDHILRLASEAVTDGKGTWDFVRWSEIWCVSTLSSEDNGRQMFRHLSRSFRQSVQDNPLVFCHTDTTPEGAQGKWCVSQGRMTTLKTHESFLPSKWLPGGPT